MNNPNPHQPAKAQVPPPQASKNLKAPHMAGRQPYRPKRQPLPSIENPVVLRKAWRGVALSNFIAHMEQEAGEGGEQQFTATRSPGAGRPGPASG